MTNIYEEKYKPIDINFLQEDGDTKEDLYLDTGIVYDGKKKYMLYLKKNQKFTSSKKEYLVKKNIDRLFIKIERTWSSPSHEETDLGITIANGSISTRVKAEKTRNVPNLSLITSSM